MEDSTTPTSSTPKFSDDGVLVDANAGSFAERQASKRGRNGCVPTRDSPILPSPCLTFPSGISPTVFLDSPIMLLNTQDLPSPTTGTFSIHQIKNEQSLLNPVMPEDGISHSSEDPYFRFAPHGGLCNLQSLLRLENQVRHLMSQQQIRKFQI